MLLLSNKLFNLLLDSKAEGAPERKERLLRLCSINFELPNNDLTILKSIDTGWLTPLNSSVNHGNHDAACLTTM